MIVTNLPRKKLLLSLWVAVVVLAIFAALPTEAKAGDCEDEVQPEEIIRLRVVPHTDDPAQQQLKMDLAAKTLSLLGSRLQEIDCAEEAKEEVSGWLDELRARLNCYHSDRDCTRRLQVTFSEQYVPKTYYGDLRLPAGIYPTVEITVGEAEGENWWCVLYPSLCLHPVDRDEDGVVITLGTGKRGKGQWKIRWAAVEFVQRLLEPKQLHLTGKPHKLFDRGQTPQVRVGESFQVKPSRLYE